MLLVSMTQHGELSSHQSGMCLGSIALLYLDPLDLFSSSKTGNFHAIKFFGEKCGISIFSPPPTGDSNETYQTEVWFIHLFRHHCGSMVSRAHGLSICGSGNCNALDRDFDGKKTTEPHFRQPKILCGAYALLDVFRQCFVFGVDVSYENYVELHHFFPTPTIIKGI